MTQSLLELDLPAADAIDRTGFDLGWDHARHGLVPAPELLHEATPVGQGWRAARATFGQRTLAASAPLRLQLALRTAAWRQGISFDVLQVTPNHLAQIQSTRCPVLRCALGGATSEPTAAVVERLNPQAGYAAGNLVVMSRRAAEARAGLDLLDLVRRARRAERAGEPEDGLPAAAWWRLAALQSYATPLRLHEAASLPLAVLPPNRVRLLNAAQGLQALLTLQFVAPGFSQRLRDVAAQLPEHTLRQDFNLFIGALLPRVLEAGDEPAARRRALEDAWLGERVQRRWQHFVLSLGEAALETLLQRLDAGTPGVKVLHHSSAGATEGWALERRGRLRVAPGDAHADRPLEALPPLRQRRAADRPRAA
ncbi:MAG: hypothetical protein KF683_16125 [Rubrivivax sp.]|nr:hypothetical protein [Rubrivivax sp.]